jgi:hypothetical protein
MKKSISFLVHDDDWGVALPHVTLHCMRFAHAKKSTLHLCIAPASEVSNLLFGLQN